MHPHHTLRTLAMAIGVVVTASTVAPTAQPAPLAMDTARVTVSGTSNVHNYSAWTDTVRVTRVTLAPAITAEPFWDRILGPGGLEHFDIAIPVATLTSREAGLDTNMYEALKADANRDIVFRLTRLEPGPSGSLLAIGRLRIAGVEREVAVPLDLERRDAGLAVKGRLPLLMTDYGITPPTAMLGMLRTDPKVTVAFQFELSTPGT